MRASGETIAAAYIERLCILLLATRGYKWVHEFSGVAR